MHGGTHLDCSGKYTFCIRLDAMHFGLIKARWFNQAVKTLVGASLPDVPPVLLTAAAHT